MNIYGLLGHPLGHSYSAAFFNDKFRSEGIDAEYRNFDFATVGEAVDALRQMPQLRGFNVTIPYKQQIIPHLAGLTPEAAAIGAVNVVKVERAADGSVSLYGANSDAYGFGESIKPLITSPRYRKALVLGTGGASKAVHHVLRSMGLETLGVSRTPKDGCITYADIDDALMAEALVVVNTTPLGMYPKVDACPAIPYELLTPQHVLFDLVYNPDVTLFMQKGAERGARVKNGLEMLHLQAIGAWNVWNAK